MDYRKDIAICPRCGKRPKIDKGKCFVCNSDIEMDTFAIGCCGIDGGRWIAKSFSILHWNLKALNSYYKLCHVVNPCIKMM